VKTAEMQAFAERDKPFEPGHKASETMKYVQHGPIAQPSAAKPHLDALLNAPSTREAVITEKKD